MTKEDYSKYYIQGSDHYLIPRYIFEELFNEMSNWKESSKKLIEVIDEVNKYIKDFKTWIEEEYGEIKDYDFELNANVVKKILDKAKGDN